MTTDVSNAISYVFAQIWRIFSGIHIPGTNVTPAHIIFIGPFITLIMVFIKDLLSMNGPTRGDRIEK